MPQTVTVKTQKTITLALTDLATVNLSGSDSGTLYMKNTGPGTVWLSFDATVATVGGVDCLGLKTGDTLSLPRLRRNSTFTCIADTASTVLTLINIG